MAMEILLTQGKVAIVDDELYDYLNQWNWQYHEGYATTSDYIGKTIDKDYYYQKRTWMHRLIVDCPMDMVVDHIDGNKLRNLSSNLRICTHNQNRYNQRPQEGKSSAYKGVTVNNAKFNARIRKDNTLYDLGLFDNEIACANCYNYHASILFGEFARLNEVPFMEKEEWLKYKKEVSSTSKYKGVSLDKRTNRFESYLWVKKKKYFLGYHNTEDSAVMARNNKIVELGLSEDKLQEVVL